MCLLCFFIANQINLRGLDGIQGPVYVGTGCVFNRTALYGYEPPVKKSKIPSFFSSCCGGSRKKNKKSSKKSSDKKKLNKLTDSTLPIYNLEDIEEGVEGNTLLLYIDFNMYVFNNKLTTSIISLFHLFGFEISRPWI